MTDITCDVCRAPAIGVACSALGPVSFAYCRECLAMRAEPYAIAVAMTATFARGPKDVASWFHATAEGTATRAGKTVEQFWADVREAAERPVSG